MQTFLALYRGKTIGDAKLIAVSVNPHLVALVATNILDQEQSGAGDPVVTTFERGRRAALRRIRQEAAHVEAE